MEDVREIELCEPAPFLYYENGQLAVTDGCSVWQVIVTCEAMMATASPPQKSLRRLTRYAPFYRELATAAIRRGDDVDGRVLVREADVLAARPRSLGRTLERFRVPTVMESVARTERTASAKSGASSSRL